MTLETFLLLFLTVLCSLSLYLLGNAQDTLNRKQAAITLSKKQHEIFLQFAQAVKRKEDLTNIKNLIWENAI